METKEKPNKATLDQWHKDPSNWKLGIFYYNKKDKRILPPKRIRGLGSTVNFANPFSVLAVFGVIILSIIIMELIKRNK